MKTKEFVKEMKGSNGFIHLFLNILLLGGTVCSMVFYSKNLMGVLLAAFFTLLIIWLIHLIGFTLVHPNKSRVLTLFGVYSGTIKKNGFFWLNPFYGKRKLSLRASNMDIAPIKVNDKNGNPIMIGMVLVWKIEDTYKACFDIEVDPQTTPNGVNRYTLNSFNNFVKVQGDAALRKVAGLYAYDHVEAGNNELTLRSGGDEINEKLETELAERLEIAGIKVIEARINYLAYASEIASVMLRRQQAEAIIAAREKIVDGAVSMVELALHKLEEKQVIVLDDEKKASMVSNLLVVLCADEAASPVINTGTLY